MPTTPKALRSKAVKLGLIGSVAGAFAPVLHALIQLVLFHSDMSISEYLHESLTSGERLSSSIFIGGTVFVMGGAGFLVGRLRERDVRLRQKVESANMELRSLNSIAAITSRSRDLDSMLYLVLKEIVSFSSANIQKRGAIFLRDEIDRDTLRLVASVGSCSGTDEFAGMRKLDIFLGGKAAEAGEILTSCDMDCEDAADLQTASPHVHVMVPINGKSEVLGVMAFYLREGARPGEEDIRIFSAAANHIGIAVENMRLMRDISFANEDVQRKSRELARNTEVLKALVEVDRIILSVPERDEMLFRVGSQIRQLVMADVGGIILKDAALGRCTVAGCWGMELDRVEFSPQCKLEQMLSSGETVCRNGFGEVERLSSIEGIMQETGVVSCCFVPIFRKGMVAGVYFIGSCMPDVISADAVRTAEAFASRMGLALEHSKLIFNLEDMSINIIHALATAIDAKSTWTKGHSERVAEYAVKIAERMGLGSRRTERLRLAGLLHDIGKIGTYDIILDKEGRLTEEELALIKQHPERGCEILSPIREFADILPGVRHHHERWDGKGYPLGLAGDDIPVEAQILTVADAFDTMTADRPYRPSIGLDNAVQELQYCAGSQFSPDVSSVFLEIIKENGHALTKLSPKPFQRHAAFVQKTELPKL